MEALGSKGWAITFAHEKHHLPASILQRYDWLPDDIILLACSIDLAVSPEEIAWFLTWEDYHGTSDSHYRWNEWELFSLETSTEESNPEAADRITGYWDDHFPLFLTTGGKLGYGYAAIRKSDHPVTTRTDWRWEACPVRNLLIRETSSASPLPPNTLRQINSKVISARQS